MWFSEKFSTSNEHIEHTPKTSEKIKKFSKATAAWLMLAMSSADAGLIDIKVWYDANYYEKYNPDTKSIDDIDHISSRNNFFIDSWRMSADGIFYTLWNTQDIQLSQKALREYDLEKVVIEVDDHYYKAQPSFKRMNFIASWKKWGFWYTAAKEIILVYVPYNNKIQVIWSISQGQFIEEHDYKEYDIWAEKDAKKQVLYKTLDMLWCDNINNCNVKSDRGGNNYFYENWRLIGFMENFWNEKILIKKHWNNKKHIATIKMYGNKILMKDIRWNILFRTNGSKKIIIDLDSLDYEIGLKVSN